MVLRFCIIVESFYLQVHDISPHISLRDLPRYRTKKHQVSLKLWSVGFPWLQQRSWIQKTYFCNYPEDPCLFDILFKRNRNKHDPGPMFPKSTSLLSTFHIGSRFCFFPAYFMSSTYTDKSNPFSRCTK